MPESQAAQPARGGRFLRHSHGKIACDGGAGLRKERTGARPDDPDRRRPTAMRDPAGFRPGQSVVGLDQQFAEPERQSGIWRYPEHPARGTDRRCGSAALGPGAAAVDRVQQADCGVHCRCSGACAVEWPGGQSEGELRPWFGGADPGRDADPRRSGQGAEQPGSRGLQVPHIRPHQHGWFGRLQSRVVRTARRGRGGLRCPERRRRSEPATGDRRGRGPPSGADAGAAQSAGAGNQPRSLVHAAPAPGA
jgi:hypothetical protein